MIPTLLDRQQLLLINRKTLKYSPVAAEKDYFLALVLQILSESPLAKTLVFKGGTALHHCYIPQSRFSEDLDFTSLDKAIQLADVNNLFTPYPFLEVKDTYTSKATLKIQRLKYAGVLQTPNSLKFEIDFMQNVVLPPQQRPYHNVWGLNVPVQVMDIREMYAEKIRAMSDRARYRDFFDFYLIQQTYHPDLAATLRLIQQKEIRKPIAKASILRNWQVASAKRQDEINVVYYKPASMPDEKRLEHALHELPFEQIG